MVCTNDHGSTVHHNGNIGRGCLKGRQGVVSPTLDGESFRLRHTLVVEELEYFEYPSKRVLSIETRDLQFEVRMVHDWLWDKGGWRRW